MGQLLSSILSSQHQSQPQSLGEDSRSSLNNDHKLIAAALRTNQIDKIKSCLLLSNTNLNFVFSQTEMCSPIQYAARYCSREVVELLIDRGARGNVDSLGMNPLHYAIARFGNVFESYEDIGAYSVEFVEAFHVFRVICERNLCPVDEQDSFGRSAFYMAAMQNLYLVCKVLKEEFGANPFLTDQLGRNAIHICWDVKLLRYLINSLGFDPNQTDLDGQTPFICAVKTNNLQICELLSSEFKCNIEAKDKNGFTALAHAVHLGNQLMASILAKKFSSNVHVVDSESRNLLHISAISSSGRDILPFIHSEFGLNSKDVDNYGRTPLHYVASSDKVDEEFKLHEYLVRVSNCPVNQRDNNGSTALHIAAQSNRVDVCKYLCEKCFADPTITNDLGSTPFLTAQAFQAAQTAKYLKIAEEEYVRRKECRLNFLHKAQIPKDSSCLFKSPLLERNLLWLIFSYARLDYAYEDT